LALVTNPPWQYDGKKLETDVTWWPVLA